jgi:hypothetical protein
MCYIDNAFMCEHSHADRHAKLLDSFLGPNSGVSEGEVTACLVGPFVGFHHQALLIATVWPEGKGNVGYGANVGSNHTLKAPDQELHNGEGCFFGLGVNIKYPSNFKAAPYTVFATGVCTLGQLLEMPFSLVNGAGEAIAGLSPAINEISPGWVLSDALFSVLRNEDKFARRNKATRSAIASQVVRADTVELLLEARLRLVAAEGKAVLKDGKGGPVYTDKQVPGLGKNYMVEASRKAAVTAYTFFVRHYLLKQVLAQAEALPAGPAPAGMTLAQLVGAPTSAAGGWAGGRAAELLLAEAGEGAAVEDLLEELVLKEKEVWRCCVSHCAPRCR